MSRPVPLHGFKSTAAQWLSDVGVDTQTFVPRQSPVFNESSFSEGREELDHLWETGAHVSWLGGPAATSADWPHNTAGTPLAHVATFHLGDAHAALGDPNERGWPNDAADMLPDHGYLQIFHDLETYGSEPDDRDEDGWLVSWHPDDPSDSRPLLVGDDGSTNAPEPALQLGLFSPGWSIPSPLDLDGLTVREFEVTDEAIEALHSAWVAERLPGQHREYAIPSTRLLGHSSTGDRVATEEILPSALPLTLDGDSYVLLVEIESWTTLSGWFGDAASLEVWMRATDLRERRFDQCWCIIRTD